MLARHASSSWSDVWCPAYLYCCAVSSFSTTSLIRAVRPQPSAQLGSLHQTTVGQISDCVRSQLIELLCSVYPRREGPAGDWIGVFLVLLLACTSSRLPATLPRRRALQMPAGPWPNQAVPGSTGFNTIPTT